MRTLCFCIVLACCGMANAVEVLAPGFVRTTLTPTLPGSCSGCTVAARNPLDGSIWMSNGVDAYKLDGLGGYTETEYLGGLTTDIAFDNAGTLYANGFNAGTALKPIYRRVVGGELTTFASVVWPRAMEVAADGNLIVLGGNGVGYDPGFAWSINPAGVVSVIGETQGEAFALDPLTGSLYIPHYLGTGIDRLDLDGTLTTLFSWDRPVPILYEAIALTTDGNFIIGVNLGADEMTFQNRSQIIRVNRLTGQRELIGADVVNAVPTDMLLSGPNELTVSGHASLHGFAIEGDLDGPIVSSTIEIPEPASGLLVALGLACVLRRNRPALVRHDAANH